MSTLDNFVAVGASFLAALLAFFITNGDELAAVGAFGITLYFSVTVLSQKD